MLTVQMGSGGRGRCGDWLMQANSHKIEAYVLVHNRTEDNAPLTIQALVDRLRA